MALANTYAPLPVRFTHGQGIWLYDEQGHRYLDSFAGIAVCGLGHAHPAIAEAIGDQAKKLIHTSNLFHIEQEEALAEKLTTITGMQNVFFANSGAEANEAAIKCARLFGHQQQINRPTIIVMENSFHGRTLATLSATGNRKAQAGFEPLVTGFIRAPFNDINALKTIAEHHDNIVAVLVEPIQGEAGVHVPSPLYLTELAKLCEQHHWLLMLDEVQTGMGRTGEWFAFQHQAIQPDVVTSAKGLGNGVPIGACLMANKAANVFTPGSHGSTFGGNPLACRASLATIDIIEQQQLCQQAKVLGEQLLTELKQHLDGHPNIVDIRGQGLMIGIECNTPCAELASIALQHGLLLNIAGGKVIRILPPLIIQPEEITLFIQKLMACIEQYFNG